MDCPTPASYKFNTIQEFSVQCFVCFIADGRSNPTFRSSVSQEMRNIAETGNLITDEMKKIAEDGEKFIEAFRKVSEQLKENQDKKNSKE